jgi:hypothetical protein
MKWYIAGSIDNNPDFGKSSRKVVRDLLDSLKIQYFCPALSEANQRNMEQKESLKDIIQCEDLPWTQILKERINPIVDMDIEGLLTNHCYFRSVCWGRNRF